MSDVKESIFRTMKLHQSEIFQAILKFGLFSTAAYFSAKILLQLLDPTNKSKTTAAKKAKDICDRLGIKQVHEFNEYELMIASHLTVPSEINISWANIGGLKGVIQELQRTVIIPIKRSELFTDSKLTQPPKGVLLHGPPGCGKTMIAKATAREASTRFINLDVSILTDKWYGESQKLAASVFSLARKLQPCIIFIDEIDSFLRCRSAQDHEATAMMKAQFMTLWDGLATDPTCTVIVMGATNRPHDLDKAILRRMPATFHIGLPDQQQRRDVLNLILKGEPIDPNVDVTYLARETDGFSGSDLTELCRNACMYRIQDYMNNQMRSSADNMRGEGHVINEDDENLDTLRKISMEDFQNSLTKIRKTKVNVSGLNLD